MGFRAPGSHASGPMFDAFGTKVCAAVSGVECSAALGVI